MPSFDIYVTQSGYRISYPPTQMLLASSQPEYDRTSAAEAGHPAAYCVLTKAGGELHQATLLNLQPPIELVVSYRVMACRVVLRRTGHYGGSRAHRFRAYGGFRQPVVERTVVSLRHVRREREERVEG